MVVPQSVSKAGKQSRSQSVSQPTTELSVNDADAILPRRRRSIIGIEKTLPIKSYYTPNHRRLSHVCRDDFD